MSFKVRKATGYIENYNSDKLIGSCLKAGFSRKEAKQIESNVVSQLSGTISTSRLEALIFKEMDAINHSLALKYRIRYVISILDPEKHEFERFICKLFEKKGYSAKHSVFIPGECITHEIDALASKNGENHLIECKHHYRYHTFTGLDVPMRQYARMEDIKNGFNLKKNEIYPHYGWVITNTKVSQHAKEYAKCKGIKLLGWNYPKESLSHMISKHKLYPVHILDLNTQQKEALLDRGILTIDDLLERSHIRINLKNTLLKRIKEQALEIVR